MARGIGENARMAPQGWLTASLLAGALIGAGPAFAQGTQGVLVIGKAADPQTLDPAVTIDNNDWTVTYPAYQRLVRYKYGGGKGGTSVEGELAESWTVSPDGLTWNFKLAPGQKFADGTPVDAEAVKFSFERLFKMKQGPAEAFPEGTAVSASGPMAVSFQLKSPYAPFLYTLANNGASIVNPKVFKAAKDGLDPKGVLSTKTAGSGPYQLASWAKGQSLVLEPNPNYGGPKPAFTSVQVKINGDAQARRKQLESGEIDIAEDLPSDQIDAVKDKPGVRVERHPSLKATYLYLNNKKAPLDNVALRKAVSWAVDYAGILDKVLAGKGKQLRGPIPDGMWGADPNLLQYTHDAAKARAELQKAPAKPSQLTFLYSSRDPLWEPIGQTVKANLAEVGIDVKLENLPNDAMRARVGKGDFDIAIGNWSPDFADPYMFMNYMFDSRNFGMPGNRSFYSNASVDDMLRKAATLTSQADRTKLYGDAQKAVVDEAAYVYLFQKSTQVALRDTVKGFVFNPMLEQIYNIGTMKKESKQP